MRGKSEIELVEWVDHLVEFGAADGSKDIHVASNSMVVFNAFRVAIKQGRLNPEDFVIKYYDLYATTCTCIVSKDGKLNVWPEGFFDMLDKQLDMLLS
jgi:predicted ATPase